MKYVKSTILAIMGLLLVACGGDNDNPSGNTNSQSVTLPATKAEQEVLLTGLTDEIENITGAKEWLTAMKSSEVKNRVKLSAKDNEGEERSCTLTITDKVGNKVLLIVRQTKKEGPADASIEDSHDLVTDQPAYTPRK